MNSENSGYPQPHLMQVIASESFGNDFLDKLGKVIKARQQTDEQEIDDQADPLDITREDIRRALDATLKKHVFSNVRPPYPITKNEILQTAYADLADLQWTDEDVPRIQEAWDRFLTSLKNLCWNDDIEGDHIDLGEWKKSHVNPDEVEFIWPTAYGCSFMIDYHPHGENTAPAFGNFYGLWSENAVTEATESFRRAAASIAKSIKLVAPAKGVNEIDALYGWANMDWRRQAWGIRLFKACAEAYFEIPERLRGNKHEMQRRLKNAVDLLIEADAQSHPAIALSLSFSAIEALVCKKTTDITEELSRNVAALLQPNPVNPLDRSEAIDFVKELYKRRSKALHGESLEVEERAESARRLAAAVLHAVVEWQQSYKSAGGAPERKSFLKELKVAVDAGQLMVGVPEDLAQFVKEP